MLEGLEATEKKLSQVQEDNLTFRLDSEYYESSYLRLIDTVSLLKTEKLADLTEWITQGPNPVFSEGSTIPCLTGRNISKGRVIYENADYISSSEYEALKRFQLRRGDTLITLKGKGAIGKIGFVTSDTKAIFSRNIGIVRPSKRINPAYLNAYILSKYGHGLVLRGETGGTGQSTLTCSYLKGLDVPRLENEDEIGNLVLYSEEVLNQANEIYVSAESYLLECLGMQDFVANPDAYNIKTLKESFLESGRIDAEYYLPKYDDLERLIESFECARLSDLCTLIDHGKQPPYVEGGEVRVFSQKWIGDKGIDYGFIDSTEEPMTSLSFATDNPEYVCRQNDIVYYSVGANIGYCHNYLSDVPMMPGSFITIIRADKSKINPLYLGFVLNSFIGRTQAEKRKSGTAQPYIYPKDLKEFIIPLIRPEVQAEIAQHIQRSFALRKEASQLLEEAKLSVERAIRAGDTGGVIT